MKHKTLKILFLYIPLAYVVVSAVLVVAFKWMPVNLTPLMAVQCIQNRGDESFHLQKKWTPIEDISENMVKAVIATEDRRFPHHLGFDHKELAKMLKSHRTHGTPITGCSTISQQTAKNCFTFCTRTWIRKAFEAFNTILIELVWGKERILEVYLNVAETGVGIFGVEAASEHYFGHPASDMTVEEAASLACCLPNPVTMNPQWVRENKREQLDKAIDFIKTH